MTSTPAPETIEVRAMQPSADELRLHPGARRRTAIILAAAALALLALVIYSGIHSRAVAESRLKQRTEEAAIPTVAVVFPREGAPTQEIVLPGNTQAFSDAPIYARTSGYLRHWYFDIGAHVQKGQLLAEIETPEVDQQLQQAQADQDTAQANLNIA
jgi:multidrug efflux pump subunit AcrA (membrane-fusion protein)